MPRKRLKNYVTSNAAIYAAIEALEKQIPKEPLNENNWHYYCPQCKKEITVLFFNVEKMSHEQKPSNFCANCGQRIVWE